MSQENFILKVVASAWFSLKIWRFCFSIRTHAKELCLWKAPCTTIKE